jgi:mercuric ion transport protein
MSMTRRQWFHIGLVSSILLALCGVTPILFIALTAVGLSAVARCLDVVLIPALVSTGLT